MLPSRLCASDPIKGYKTAERARGQMEITARKRRRRQRPKVNREVVTRE